jgi:phosphopantothenate-cysteine ligase
MGTAEIVAYFRFHHFLYYNSNLKTSVEFAA